MSMANEIRPSGITNKRFAFYPPDSFERGGKWQIYLNGDYDLLDCYWRALTPLCDAGILTKVCATTAIDGPEGFFLCLTEDCNDLRGVLRAAEAIREAIDYKYIMYYKNNNVEFHERGEKKPSAYDNRRRLKGYSKYMYTVRGCFYENDELKRWRVVPLGNLSA